MSDLAAWIAEQDEGLATWVKPGWSFIVEGDPASGATNGDTFMSTLAYVDLLKEVRARGGNV